jgi:hypothetical protein
MLQYKILVKIILKNVDEFFLNSWLIVWFWNDDTCGLKKYDIVIWKEKKKKSWSNEGYKNQMHWKFLDSRNYFLQIIFSFLIIDGWMHECVDQKWHMITFS